MAPIRRIQSWHDVNPGRRGRPIDDSARGPVLAQQRPYARSAGPAPRNWTLDRPGRRGSVRRQGVPHAGGRRQRRRAHALGVHQSDVAVQPEPAVQRRRGAITHLVEATSKTSCRIGGVVRHAPAASARMPPRPLPQTGCHYSPRQLAPAARRDAASIGTQPASSGE